MRPAGPDPLGGGFADPPLAAARAFRAVLDALARPGRIARLEGAAPPAPLSPAAGVLLLTLADATTPVHLAPSHATADLTRWIGFHCGAPLVGADAAVFAVGPWDGLDPVGRYAAGSAEYPDRSATLIVEVAALEPANARLTGPGIRGEAWLRLPDPAALAANHARYPLGFDLFLTCGDRIAGLPRSTKVEAV